MVIIIGSGASGGMLAMELAKANIPVILFEKGPNLQTKDAFKCYCENEDDIDLLRTSCVGGSTLVSAGNGVRSLEKELLDYGINLSKEFEEVEKLLNIHTMNDSHFGKGNRLFIDSALKLGLNASKMPKFIEEEKCTNCGNCSFGCPNNAKWSSKVFLKKATEYGAELIFNAKCTDLIIEKGKIKGVSVVSNGSLKTFYSDTVILCGGAIDSAILLQDIGINAGEQLFMDPFVTLGGVLKDISINKEIQMNSFVKGENFIISPHFSTYIPNNIEDESIKDNDIFSLMVKIPDEGKGFIKKGKITKINTINDIKILAESCAVAGAILKEAGVDSNTIVSTIYRGAHPSGTAAIGKVVDKDLKTKIKGLYVADASVLPKSPGLPPILTILALSKRLAKYLIEK